MEEKKKTLKVFFIVSNQSSLDDKIEYSLKKGGMINLQSVISKPFKHKKDEFTTSVYSFDFEKENLNELDKDKEKKLYKANIQLTQKEPIYKKDKIFHGFLYFKENKNNFIYNFKFDEYKSLMGKILLPPLSIKFPASAQIKLFKEALKKLNIKQDHPISKDLILDSQLLIINNKSKKYNLDFYLEIMKSCYTQSWVKTLLMAFKLERVQIPTDYEINPDNYSKFLSLIEKKPNIIMKHCSNKDNPEKYYQYFYSLLLYFRANYEKKKYKNYYQTKTYLNILKI